MDNNLIERLRLLRLEIEHIKQYTQETRYDPELSLAQIQAQETMRGRLRQIIEELNQMKEPEKIES
jgi:hypothetical protein